MTPEVLNEAIEATAAAIALSTDDSDGDDVRDAIHRALLAVTGEWRLRETVVDFQQVRERVQNNCGACLNVLMLGRITAPTPGDVRGLREAVDLLSSALDLLAGRTPPADESPGAEVSSVTLDGLEDALPWGTKDDWSKLWMPMGDEMLVLPVSMALADRIRAAGKEALQKARFVVSVHMQVPDEAHH